MLALDSSGSMDSFNVFDSDGDGVNDQTPQDVQQTAVKALIDSLPRDNVSVGVVDHDNTATLISPLRPIIDDANRTVLKTATDTVDALGGTDMEDGINASRSELIARGTNGRQKQIVPLGDGDQPDTAPERAAQSAFFNFGYVTNTVALPGSNVAKMQAIAAAGRGTFVDATSDVQALLDLFSGLGGGGLAGVTDLTVTGPGGAIAASLCALGDFMFDSGPLAVGNNVFNVSATFDDMTSAQAQITLIGREVMAPIPLPAGAVLLLTGLGALLAARRVKRAA